MKPLIYLLISILLWNQPTHSKENDRPIYGILTQPFNNNPYSYTSNYLAASYVKFIEGSGGRVVPIHWDSSETEIRKVFGKINGVLWPGGGTGFKGDPLTPFGEVGKLLYDLVIEANQKGDYMPLYVECLGFEMLNYIVTMDKNFMESTSDHDCRQNIEFYVDPHTTRFYRNISDELLQQISNDEIVYFNHGYGFTKSRWLGNPIITKNYSLLSFNKDNNGYDVVDAIEHKQFPIYGVQFHAEKNPFEFHVNASHTAEAVDATQYFSNFVVQEARKNFHSFSSQEEEDQYLIYNYNTEVSSEKSDFDEIYVFPKQTTRTIE